MECAALIGFGDSAQGSSPLTSTINMENLTDYVIGFYFMIPFAIEINSLIAFFHTISLSFQTIPTVTVRAPLYEVKETSNIFSAIEEMLISITDAMPYGTLLRSEIRTNRSEHKADAGIFCNVKRTRSD